MSRSIAYVSRRKRRFVHVNAAYERAEPVGALSTVVLAAHSDTLRVGDTRLDGTEVTDADDDGAPVPRPHAGEPVFVRYPAQSPAIYMGRSLPVLCVSDSKDAVYVGVMHHRQCKQYYRKARTLLVQVRGKVTMHVELNDKGVWEVPVYLNNDGEPWDFGPTTHANGGRWLLPPGRVTRSRQPAS